MKKLYLLICMCLCVGCSKSGSMQNDNLNLENAFQDIQAEILENDWKIGTLNEDAIDEEQLLQEYGISNEDVEEFMVKQAILPASCGEIAIFHVKGTDTSRVENAISNRIASLQEEMELLPMQRQCIEQHQTMKIGNYMILVVGVDAQNVIQYISSL